MNHFVFPVDYTNSLNSIRPLYIYADFINRNLNNTMEYSYPVRYLFKLEKKKTISLLKNQNS